MATHLNGIHLQGIGKRNGANFDVGTISFTQPSGTALTGYVQPNLQSFDISHKAEIDPVPNQAGNTSAIIANDEYIEIAFDFIPQSTTTDADTRLSATIPEVLSKAAITNLPIIQIGPFLDALNTNGTNTQPWIYLGDGGLNAPTSKEKWNGKITLRRYKNIAAAAAYSTV